MICPDAVIVLSPHTVKTALTYNTLTDFVPVAHLGSYEYGVAVNTGVPVKDLKEWLAWVKTDPKNATYGTSGSGTGPQFMGVMLAQAAGVSLVHVPYRGVGPAVADLVGGQLPAVMLPYAQMMPLQKAGKIRILAHSGGARAAVAPEIPTFKELGYPTMELSGWYGMMAPAGTPPQLVARYNEIVIQAMRTPAVRERMRSLDLGIQEMSPREMTAMIKTQFEHWRPIVKASGYSADNQ
jgi:tripartite-type tricarboxylate transporter receptor subunit TctC